MKLLSDLRNLDFNDVGSWSTSVKTFIIVCLMGVIVLIGWYFHISTQQDTLVQRKHRETALRSEFKTKQAKAVNLDDLRKKLVDMKNMMRQMLRQLPSKTEMPALLIDISQTALASGLQTEIFAPKVELKKDFYAEQPIELKMIGTYHQFGDFISGVASLPRVVILTMHDVSLKPKKAASSGVGASSKLTLEGTVRTYRYLDDEGSLDKNIGHGKSGKVK